MEEANGFRALLSLEEPKYSVEQIAARTGKSPAYVAGRLKLTELAPVVVEAFYREEIGVGHALLLANVRQDACTDPTCYHAKVDAHVAKTVAAKPKLVQISTAYGQQQEGSATLPRNRYTEIRPEKPTTKEEATRPEFKTCKYTTEAIVSDGIDSSRARTMRSGRPSRRSSAKRPRLPTRPASASSAQSQQRFRCG